MTTVCVASQRDAGRGDSGGDLDQHLATTIVPHGFRGSLRTSSLADLIAVSPIIPKDPHVPPDARAVADLRHRRDRLCLRHLRAADAAARSSAPALRELVHVAPGTPAYNQWVGTAVLDSGDGRRRLRAARRLPDGSARAAARARVEHPDLRVLHARGGLQHDHLAVPVLPVHDVHRRVRGVRRGRRLARRAVLRAEAARARARLHAGVLVASAARW